MISVETYILSKKYTDKQVKDHKSVLQPATADELGGVMIDTNTIQLAANGKISIASIGADDIANLFS